jgi:hypothetical protein
VREIVQTVLTHRVIVRREAPYAQQGAAEVIQGIIDQTPVAG